MLRRWHQRKAMEDAVAYLVGQSLVFIRFQVSLLRNERDPERLAKGHEQIWMLADVCHSLPPWMAPSRRNDIREGVRWMWDTASPTKRDWVRHCWDELGYDYRWLEQRLS
jgi:hypothetical protein